MSEGGKENLVQQSKEEPSVSSKTFGDITVEWDPKMGDPNINVDEDSRTSLEWEQGDLVLLREHEILSTNLSSDEGFIRVKRKNEKGEFKTIAEVEQEASGGNIDQSMSISGLGGIRRITQSSKTKD